MHKQTLGPGSFEGELRRRSRRRRESLKQAAHAEPQITRNDIVPKLEWVEVPIETLTAPARNVRTVEKDHVQEVVTSISVFGYCAPVIIDQDNRILDGVVRWLACKQLNLASIACVKVGHLSATERRALRLALNRLGEKGRWDFRELRIELNELVLENAPIEIAFNPIEIDQINQDPDPPSQETGPLEPGADAVAVARPGDIFLLGDHVLTCGDARDPNVVGMVMADELARVVLTDQPYNVPVAGHITKKDHREFAMASGEMTEDEFLAFNEAWIAASLAFLLDGGLLGTFIDWRGYASVTLAARKLDLNPFNLIVWAKTNAGMGSLYRSQHELLPLFKKGTEPHVNNVELGKHGRWRSNLWHYPGASSVGSDARKGLQVHPTVKPIAMLEDALLDLTREGEIVLDPFLGSGSTLLAAEKAGRRCRGIEIDPRYVDVTIRRFEAATGQQSRLKVSGKTFGETAAERAS